MEQKSYKKNRCAFITEANKNIGYGHLYRCIALAQELIANNFKVDFFCDGMNPRKIISDVAKGTKNYEICALNDIMHNYDLIIIDVYKSSWENFQWLTQVKNLKTACIIDYAFREFAIPADFIFEIGFQEYAFKEIIKQIDNEKKSKIFSGKDLLIFRHEFKNAPNFKVRKEANRILISMGGSDPYKLTELVSFVLAKIKKPLYITLILGADVSERRYSDLNLLFLETEHTVKILQNVTDICTHMLNNDISIINGGNTRFELTLLGVPFISISINSVQNSIASKLEKNGIGKNLGVFSELKEGTIQSEVEMMLNNFEYRKDISSKYKRVFKIHNKIVDILLHELHFS